MVPALTCLLLAQLAATPGPSPAPAPSPAPSPAPAATAAQASVPAIRVIHVRRSPRDQPPSVCHLLVQTADPATDPGLVQSGEPVFDRHLAVSAPCRPTSVEPEAKRR